MNGFEQMNMIGKIGEKDFIDYCRTQGFDIVDVSDDKKYQKIDVDFLVNGFYTELKTDNLIHKTNNFPIELIIHRKTGDRQGWYYYCQAKYVIRYSKQIKRLYILYFDKCKDYILKNCKQRKWFDKADNNYTTGILLNVDEMVKLGYMRIIDMDKTKD